MPCPRSSSPFAEDPAGKALSLDFDGTLSPIVADPVGARPWPGVPALLARLAARFALVAVISGRPAEFCSAKFWAHPPASRSSACTAWAMWVPTPGPGSP